MQTHSGSTESDPTVDSKPNIPPRRRTGSFSGRQRRKTTPWHVLVADRVSYAVITIGGIGTIVAVSLVFIFLAFVVLPLFFPGASAEVAADFGIPWRQGECVYVTLDEYQSLGCALDRNGTVTVFRPDNGEILDQSKIIDSGTSITAVSENPGQRRIAIGSEDGRVRFIQFEFTTKYLEADDVAPAFRELSVGARAAYESGIVERTPQEQWRVQLPTIEVQHDVNISNAAIVALAHTPREAASDHTFAVSGSERDLCVAVDRSGRVQYVQLIVQENVFSAQKSVETMVTDVPRKADDASIKHLLLSSNGDRFIAVASDGAAARYDASNPQEILLREELDLVPRPEAHVTAVCQMLGNDTVLVGDSEGNLTAWFLVRQPAAAAGDGFRLTMTHPLYRRSHPVTSLGASSRTRMLIAGYGDGSAAVYHVTSDRYVVDIPAIHKDPLNFAQLLPKDDGIFLASDSTASLWSFDPKHPEVSLRSIFAPVWYEGYDSAQHIWQSSFAGVESEMKLGMLPLVFGTMKATFYSMLFGAPLALLAAIYTSEFASPRIRSRLKPTVEMMASLPSVVLGFLAALVFAPWVEHGLGALLACFITVPVVVLFVSFAFQLLPAPWILRLSRNRLAMILMVLPAGIGAGVVTGPVLERWLFGGDIMRWLDHQVGAAVGGWFYLNLPVSAALVTLFMVGPVNSWMRTYCGHWAYRNFAWLNLAKFILGVVMVFVLAAAIAVVLQRLGFDPRGPFVDTYVHRNALVVGFVMGFAVIPIIYTIADDSLTAVPRHLRNASFGAGATPWQTAVRVVIPTAMSGLFSAVMIGLGRAVGETMIVLMAAGNMPVMEWNVFNGFRTLAANIAVELPEAVRGSTHYRTLFLAALTLFLLTFMINTLAEVVRQQFRKRSSQL